MSKPGNQFLLAAIAIGLFALLAYVVQRRGLESQEAAAYVQAILSAGAIVASVKLAYHQRVQERRKCAERQLKELLFAAHQIQTIVTNTTVQPKGPTLDFVRANLTALLESINALKADDLPVGAYSIIFAIRACCVGLISALGHPDPAWLAAIKHGQKIIHAEMEKVKALGHELDRQYNE